MEMTEPVKKLTDEEKLRVLDILSKNITLDIGYADFNMTQIYSASLHLCLYIVKPNDDYFLYPGGSAPEKLSKEDAELWR
jgi:hypothetical protein